MRKLVSLALLICLAMASNAQAPQGFSYQAVLRNAEGQPLAEQDVSIRLTLQAEDGKTAYYSETHSTTTSPQGVISVAVGSGSGISGSLADTPWESGGIHLKVEVDPAGGTTYNLLGTSPLLAVPYALFALSGEPGADGVGITDITDNGNGTLTINLSDGSSYTTSDLTGPMGPAGTGLNNKGAWVEGASYEPGDYVFHRSTDNAEINSMWICQADEAFTSSTPPYLDLTHWVEFQAPQGEQGPQGPEGPLVVGTTGQTIRHDGTAWVASSNLHNADANVGVGTVTPSEKLEVAGNIKAQGRLIGQSVEVNPPLPEEEPIFVVRNSQNQIVFAVYEGGVRAYVDDTRKQTRGGFAIGGLSDQIKAKEGLHYFSLTPDSVRFNIFNPVDKGKQTRGGFAIGGLSDQIKGPVASDLFYISKDMARIYIDTTNTGKQTRGGFAIGGLSDQLKGDGKSLMYVGIDSTRIYIDDKVGKQTRGGFAVGGLSDQNKTLGSHFFNISPDASGYIESQPRILWYPLKNAFLAGQVKVDDPANVGENSMSIGYETKAKGSWSQALGYKSTANGNYSTSIGKNAIANSNNSFAFGDGANALNEDSYAFGAFTQASGIGSFAFGYVGRDTLGPTGNITMAEGNYSFAMGLGSRTSGESAVAIGSEVLASAPFSTAFGHKNKATNWYALSFGTRSEATGKYAIAMGYFAKAVGELSYAIGTSSEASSKYSFAIGLGAKASAYNSIAIGSFVYALADYSTAIGHQNTAEGQYSTSIGRYSNAKGENSFAIGYFAKTGVNGNKAISIGPNTEANGISSISLGVYSVASGAYSVAIGSTSRTWAYCATAIGDHADAYNRGSVAIGSGVQALGRYSTVIGKNAYAHSYGSFVFGQYNEENIAYDSTQWVATDPLFILANGTGYGNRSNAITILKNGNMGIGSSQPTEKLIIEGNATISGTVTATEFVGDFSGDINGTVNELTMGKVNLTSTGDIASINGGFNLKWDSSTRTIYLDNTSVGSYCHIWYKGQRGATAIGESIVTNEDEVLIDKNIEDGWGYEIHFGDAEGGTSYCSVWLQYSSNSNRLIGHYTSF